jgi:hypothetical protein
MSVTPEDIIYDLVKYMDLYNIVLSKEAKKTLFDIEEFSFKCNYPCKCILFFSKIIRNTKEIQKIIYGKKLNPNLAALLLEISFYDCLDRNTDYQKGTKLYSYIHDRSSHDKTSILDKALQYCVGDERTILENRDILLAAMDFFTAYIERENMNWLDNRLNTDYLTLAHVCGKYDDNLWISFKEMREYVTKNTERESYSLVKILQR